MTTLETTGMSGLRKAAVLLVQMGKDDSARLMSQLRESEVEELTAEIARLGQVDPMAADDVLDEFHSMAVKGFAGQGGIDYARELLEASIGEERASLIMDRLSASVTDMPFNFLSHAEPRQVLSFLQHEH